MVNDTGGLNVFKKMNISSPLGIALMAAGVILALSPDARRAIRRCMVKGTAGVMDMVEQVGGVTAGMVKQPTVTWKSDGQLDQPAHDEQASVTELHTEKNSENIDGTEKVDDHFN
jgi:hypothetical protein